MTGMLKNARLSSILETSQAHTRPAERVATLPTAQLLSGSQQPRRSFDEGGLRDLANSIADKGILQPLLVRQLPGSGYEIVAGERRWRAAQLAGVEQVPVIIRSFTDQEAAVVALLENLQRENLNTIDEVDGKLRVIGAALGIPVEQVPTRLNELRRTPVAEEIETLQTVFSPLGETWESFAKNKLRILNYPSHLVEALRQGMALRLVTLIASAPEEEQARLIAQAEAGTPFKDIKAEVERLRKPVVADRAKQVGRFLASSRMNRLPAGLRTQVQTWLEQMPPDFSRLLEDE